MKNKKTIILIFIIIILLLIGIFYYQRKKDSIVFKLNGEENMIVKYGYSYEEPGFTAIDGFGNDISSNVTVDGSVNTLVSGIYQIFYELNYNNQKMSLKRTIAVKNVTMDDLEIVINGDKEIYLLKDSKYVEEGAVIYNRLDKSIFYGGDLVVTSDIDTTKVGTYVVNYQFNYSGDVLNATRNIIIFDINYVVTPTELTTGKVNINLNLDTVQNINSVLLPDGTNEYNKNINYEVNSNGSYTFTIKLLNEKEFTKEIIVDNIIPNYTCNGEITNTGTKISVSPTDNVVGYKWITNVDTSNGTSTYTKNKSVKSANVELTFNNSKTYTVNCNIFDKLVYHFKYDEGNTKPFMSCNTYTSADRTRLEAQLKQVVAEAGYGTRAGSVAAARFLVGGLDYKVPYLGPKKDNVELGRYSQVGLNIGKNNAWGCHVSGWTQGMDCTNFVSWAWSQNGIKDNPYKYERSKVRDVINQIKVGDLLYTSCTTTKNDYGLCHVGIIIGIDDKYIYVAEATTGNINAIIVSKWEKNNMPAEGKFSLVHFYNYNKYSGEGNVTNMWME